MKHILIVCLFLGLTGTTGAQSAASAQQIIKREIDSGFFDGHDQKILGYLGDAGAVILTKILSDSSLTSHTISSSLAVLNECFADPRFVEDENDRQPRTALLLLKYFDASTNDSALKARIADTRKYINARYAESLSPKRD